MTHPRPPNSMVKEAAQYHNVTSCELRKKLFCRVVRWKSADVSSPFLGLKSEARKKTVLLAICFMMVSSLVSPFTLKIAWRYILWDRILHNHRCENVKSYTILFDRTELHCFGRSFRPYSFFRKLLLSLLFRWGMERCKILLGKPKVKKPHMALSGRDKLGVKEIRSYEYSCYYGHRCD
jgi:hypothetical protein